jgi:O-methyltransferase
MACSMTVLKGWFKDTLPTAPIERLAILRVDGDMYSSTTDSLLNLYPRLSMGGYVIIDDYGEIDSCRKAVDDFRASKKIETPLTSIDLSGVYWKKLT